MTDRLAPHFLGAYAENDDFLEKTLTELLRDHVYWRRNFHPEDAPPISTRAQVEPDFLDERAKTRHALHQLTAKLKRSVPFFHPRYLGHMVSDLLLPGLIAQLVTTLYNPNNVAEDAAPVTVRLELEVGQQLSQMVGYATAPETTPCALGHLTSGGTLANDEALWLARAVRLAPLALRDAGAATDRWLDDSLRRADDFELLEWPLKRTLEAVQQLRAPENAELRAAFEAHRVETVGLARFVQRHPLTSELVVLAPGTAHYSWQKAMKLLGLGTEQLLEVPTVQARLHAPALKAMLTERARRRLPVLAVIGVYGSTEFGTLDPLHEIAALRGSTLQFWWHVDAAWGGYIPSLFRTPEGALRPREAVASTFRYFPSERVYRSTEALAAADSITVDPHKLGFVPYGAGAFLARDRRVFDLMHQEAAYVFGRGAAEGEARYRRPGRFSLEGSRPGASAAACAVNHQVLPLHSEGFGALIARSVRASEVLFDRVQVLREELAPVVRVTIPFEPDCNLICLALNPRGNRSLAHANAFARSVFDAMAVRADLPVQVRRFFGSCTTVALTHLGSAERSRLATELDLDLLTADDDGLFMLRHTLMNPWLLASPNAEEPSYLEAYCRYLSELVRQAASAT